MSELNRLGELLRACGDIAISARGRLEACLKPDDSIVTNADREIESFLRIELPGLVPGTTVWGEEEGFEEPGENGLWLVDPVDGTSNFRYGQPLWGVSIALFRGGSLDLGGIYLPDFDELYLAARGKGATMNGCTIPPIPPGKPISSELINCANEVLFEYGEAKLGAKPRISGACVIGGAWVACQRYRALISRGENLYDAAAAIVINRELGADVRFANGDPFVDADWLRPIPIEPEWIIFPPNSGFRL